MFISRPTVSSVNFTLCYNSVTLEDMLLPDACIFVCMLISRPTLWYVYFTVCNGPVTPCLILHTCMGVLQ